jgi:hypothetical protein
VARTPGDGGVCHEGVVGIILAQGDPQPGNGTFKVFYGNPERPLSVLGTIFLIYSGRPGK